MQTQFTTRGNTDRDDIFIDFYEDEEPMVGIVLKIEDELVWRDTENSYTRGICGTEADRYFDGTICRVAGIAQIEWMDEK